MKLGRFVAQLLFDNAHKLAFRGDEKKKVPSFSEVLHQVLSEIRRVKRRMAGGTV